MFTDETGERLSYRSWKPMWADAAAKAGVEGTTHDFRHYCASALIAGGASVVQVQHLLGNASSVITLRTYAHLFPGDYDRIRGALEAETVLLATEDNLRAVIISRG
jgi:integrase